MEFKKILDRIFDTNDYGEVTGNGYDFIESWMRF